MAIMVWKTPGRDITCTPGQIISILGVFSALRISIICTLGDVISTAEGIRYTEWIPSVLRRDVISSAEVVEYCGEISPV